jgi:hypothetical protein
MPQSLKDTKFHYVQNLSEGIELKVFQYKERIGLLGNKRP